MPGDGSAASPAPTPSASPMRTRSGLASLRGAAAAVWRSGRGSLWVAVGWLVLLAAAALALVLGRGAGDGLRDALDLSRQFR